MIHDPLRDMRVRRLAIDELIERDHRGVRPTSLLIRTTREPQEKT